MKRIIFLTTLSLALCAGATAERASTSLRADRYASLMLADTLDPATRLAYIDTLEKMGYWEIPANRHKLGRAYILSGRFDHAEAVFDSLSAVRGQSIDRRLNAVYWVAFCNLILGDYDKSLEFVYTMMTLEKPDSLAYYDVESDLIVSGVYDKLGNRRRSAHYLNRAIRKLAAMDSDNPSVRSLGYRLDMEKASYYLAVKDYDRAVKYNLRARDAGIDRYSIALILMDLARICDETGEYDMAEEYYRQFFAQVPYNYVARFNMGYATSNYVLFLHNRGRYGESLGVAQEFLSRPEAVANRHVSSSIYETMAMDYEALGRDREAYDALRQSREIIDSVNAAGINHAAMAASRRFEEKLAMDSIARIKSRERRSMMLITALIVLTALLSVAALWLWRRWAGQRNRSERLFSKMNARAIEYRNDIIESQSQLNASSREIVGLSMQMAEKDAIIAEIKALASKPISQADSVLATIRNRLMVVRPSQHTWEVFKLYFEKSHPDFFKRIHSRHPDLTPGETKMCAFINMGLSCKEIAGITCRSERAVETMKYRLHKKLGLKPGMSTRAYILEISSGT